MDEPRFSEGIMISNKSDLWHSYRVECLCQDPMHDFSFDIELDKELNEINLVVTANMYTKYYSYYRNWLIEKTFNFFGRIKMAFHLLFMGYYETTGCFTFKNVQQIDNLITAINYSREKLQESCREYGEFKPLD